jgi:hypothetical protein
MRPSVQTRLQRLLSNSVPSKIRVTPVFQLAGSYMSAEQTYQLQQSLIPGAIHVLQKYIQVQSSRGNRRVAVAQQQTNQGMTSVLCLSWLTTLSDWSPSLTGSPSSHEPAPGGRPLHLQPIVCRHVPRCARNTVESSS